MVFYIIACYKEKMRETDVGQIVQNQVLKDGQRVLGELYHLTEGVSNQNSNIIALLLIINGIFQWLTI